jgi:two-component system, OmpR family, sensor histidine kinase VicK
LASQPHNEKSEVIYGMDKIINITLNRFSLTKYKIDSCIDKSNPKTIITAEPIVKGIIDLNNRGIKSRVITEITKDNISYCKELMKLSIELRHLDDVKGNFSISDGRIYQATAMGDFSVPGNRLDSNEDNFASKERPNVADIETETIISNVSGFVSQQQYFFDMLWRKAIPAKQRMKEIEQGLKRAFIDTIQDPKEIMSIVTSIIMSAAEELLLIFPTTATFKRFENEGILSLIKNEATKNAIKVRILVDKGKKNKIVEEKIAQLTKKYPNMNIQYLSQDNKIKVITIIADRDLSLVIELKDDNKEPNTEAIGLTTYSNSEATILSYASIFETLWIQSDLQQPQDR